MASRKQDINLLTDALRELRMLYDKYFAGQLRLEPRRERDDFEQKMRVLKRLRDLPTEERFRLQSLQASFVSYSSYWNRLNRQIDEGTFKRDVRRATRMAPREKVQPAKSKSDYILSEKPSQKDLPWIDQIHSEFVERRKACGESTKISKTALDKLLRKEAAAIRKSTRCGEVCFKVQIKDGRAVLKAKPL
tara:strand:- start:369 stop:941 length:573 start_codon:yes stop_codon:yes gene_type:complete